MLRFLVAALLISAVAVSGRINYDDYDYEYDDFETQGLEQLTQRYGAAYPSVKTS